MMLALAALASCSNSEKIDSIELADIAQKQIVMSPDKTSTSISFESANEWNATTNASWINLSPQKGSGGQATLAINADSNEGINQREATIEILSGDAKETIHVTQEQKDAIVIDKKEYNIGSDGGEITIEVEHNIDMEVKCDTYWIKSLPTKSHQTTAKRFAIAENKSYENREGFIKFISKDKKIVQNIKIKQSMKNELIVDDDEYERTYSHKAQEVYIRIKTNVQYEIDIQNGKDWLRQEKTRALEAQMLKFHLKENTEPDPRTAKIIFTSENLKKEIIIHQSGNPVLKLDESEKELDWKGGEMNVYVNSNVDYEIIMNDCGWLRKSETESKNITTDIYTFKFDRNEDTQSRSTIITFKPKRENMSDVLLKITQEGRLVVYNEGEKLPKGVYIAYVEEGINHAVILTRYKKESYKTPFGIVVSNGEHQTIVSLTHNKSFFKFQSAPYELIDGAAIAENAEQAKEDFEGKKNTEAILKWSKTESNRLTEAATWASEYEYAGVDGWYLPSAGQGAMIVEYDLEIFMALEFLGDKVDYLYSKFWTSTQKSTTHAWRWGDADTNVYPHYKGSNELRVRAVRDF